MHLEIFMQQREFGFPFQRLNGKKKGMTHAVSSYELTRKPCLMFLKVKLQKDRGC